MGGIVAKLRRVSLRARIAVGMVALSLLILWTAVLLTLHNLRNELEDSLSARQFSTVSMIAVEIDRSLRERLGTLDSLAQTLSAQTTTGGSGIQATLERYPLPEILFNWGVVVTDRNGVGIASIPEALGRSGVDFSAYPGIRETLSGQTGFVTEPFLSGHTNAPIVAMMQPIRNSEGVVIGAVVGVTNLAKPNFLDEISRTRYGQTGDYIVTDPKTRSYVASSDPARVLKKGPPSGINPVYDKYINGFEGSGVARSSRGVVELSSSKIIPTTGWLMQSVLPTSEAFAPITNLQNQLMAISVGLTLLAGILSWFWLRRQLAPLGEAFSYVEKMRQGDIPRQSIPIRREDEVGALVASFNALQKVIIAEEEKAAEHAANMRVKRIVSSVPGMVFQYRIHPDGHGDFPFASDGIRELYGITPTDVQDSSAIIRQMAHPEDRDHYLRALKECADTMQPLHFEYRISLPDGRIKWLLVRGIPERSNGDYVTIFGVVTDISELKSMEADLREAIAEHQRKDAEISVYRDHLEQLVELRTADLEQARADAERLAKAKSEFLAKMSHEIRTPLHGVLGMARIGQKATEEGSKAHDAFSKITHSGQLLLGILNDILDFSKMEAGMMKIEQNEVDLNGVLDETIELMQERANAKGLALKLQKSANLPVHCLSDALRLRQVLLNLLSNSVKFTDSGSVTLEASQKSDHLCFRISDTGIGITPDQLDKIFNPFEQGDNTMSRRFGGTGLGLAITEHIVRLLGGTITVTSTPDVGSCFEVSLPFIPVDVPPPETSPSEPSIHDCDQPLAGIRVLVAEDIDINQHIMQELLSDVGASPHIVGDGRAAVEAVRALGTDAFDIVLMDIQMPVMNGHEASRELLSLDPTLPIIGQTAHALPEEREACAASGMVAHISKPIDPEELFALILKHRRPRS